MCETTYYPFAADMDISEHGWEVFLREWWWAWRPSWSTR
jgi:hypothetical protein